MSRKSHLLHFLYNKFDDFGTGVIIINDGREGQDRKRAILHKKRENVNFRQGGLRPPCQPLVYCGLSNIVYILYISKKGSILPKKIVFEGGAARWAGRGRKGPLPQSWELSPLFRYDKTVC